MSVRDHARTTYCEAEYRDAYGLKKTKRVKVGDGNLTEAPEARSLAMLELGKIRSGGYVDGPATTKPGDATVRAAYDFMLDLLPLPLGKFRNIYMAYATKARVSPLLIKKLVNHKVVDVTEGYAAQDDLLLPDLLREQEKITAVLTAT